MRAPRSLIGDNLPRDILLGRGKLELYEAEARPSLQLSLTWAPVRVIEHLKAHCVPFSSSRLSLFHQSITSVPWAFIRIWQDPCTTLDYSLRGQAAHRMHVGDPSEGNLSQNPIV